MVALCMYDNLCDRAKQYDYILFARDVTYNTSVVLTHWRLGDAYMRQ